ncbi:MAG TPA: hypothetical protein VFJ14_11990 [Nocardioidaceae bacterium]|nr:hypothetical protein [Nocardioidaceae bacterium]
MKRAGALASAMIMAGLLAGCGGDGGSSEASATESYCDSLKDTKEQIDALQGGGAGGAADLQKAVDSMQQLATESPDAVQSEWETVDTAFTELEKGLQEAGLSLNDLPKLMQNPNNLPEGVDRQKLMELGPKLQQAFGGQELQQSMDAISKHAKKECGVELGS